MRRLEHRRTHRCGPYINNRYPKKTLAADAIFAFDFGKKTGMSGGVKLVNGITCAWFMMQRAAASHCDESALM